MPIGSMYGIYGNIYHQYTPNVSIYTIHGSYGMGKDLEWLRVYVRPLRERCAGDLFFGVLAVSNASQEVFPWKYGLPSANLTRLWKITMFHGKIHYKWWFSIVMLNYQRAIGFPWREHDLHIVDFHGFSTFKCYWKARKSENIWNIPWYLQKSQ